MFKLYAPFYKISSPSIKNAKKPIVILGRGSVSSYKTVRKFVNKINIPTTSTLHALGTFPSNHKLSLPMLGMHGSLASNIAIQQADLIINLGSRFDDRIVGNPELFAPNAIAAAEEGTGGIIHVNFEKNEFNKMIKSHYNFNLNVETFLNFVDYYNFDLFNERKDWLKEI